MKRNSRVVGTGFSLSKFTYAGVADTSEVGLCTRQAKGIHEALPEPKKLLSCLCRSCTRDIALGEANRNGLVDVLPKIGSQSLPLMSKGGP